MDITNTIGKIGGRKFLMALIGLVAVVLNAKFGIAEQQTLTVSGIVAAYILGQGISDGMTGGATYSVTQVQAGRGIVVKK